MIDHEILDIVLRSIYVSGLATLAALSWSIPVAYILASRRGAEVVASVVEAMVGIPTVVLGLLLYFLFSHSGPLGFLGLLYTPQAMVIGESVLVTPLIVSTSFRVLRASLSTYGEFAASMGATRLQTLYLVMRESYTALLASGIMGFSRAIGELGIAMMVGGNIAGYTRVMTTAIALGVSKGEFETSLVLGLVLVLIMVLIAVALKVLGRVQRA